MKWIKKNGEEAADQKRNVVAVSTDAVEIKAKQNKTVREHYQQLEANKFEILNELEEFL